MTFAEQAEKFHSMALHGAPAQERSCAVSHSFAQSELARFTAVVQQLCTKLADQKIKPGNLKTLCWARGMSVADLASKIGRHRVSVHRAVKNPAQNAPTFAKIQEVLCA